MAMADVVAVAANECGSWYAFCDAWNNDACVQMAMVGAAAVVANVAIMLLEPLIP
jgi:hypothetical protein